SRKKAKKSAGNPAKAMSVFQLARMAGGGAALRLPAGQGWRELADQARLIALDLFAGQHIAPAAVASGVEEGFVPVLPGLTAAEHEDGTAFPHRLETRRRDERRPDGLVDRKAQEGRDAAHLAVEIGFEVVVVDQQDVGPATVAPERTLDVEIARRRHVVGE